VNSLDLAAVGNQVAIDDVCREYRPFAVRYATTYAHRPADVEDVAQEALMDALKALPQLRSRTDVVFKAYLRRAARSHAVDVGKRLLVPAEGVAFEDDALDRLDGGAAARAHVETMDASDVEMAEMLADGYSVKEIAEQRGLKVDTVYKWRARLQASTIRLVAKVDMDPAAPAACREFRVGMAPYLEERLPDGSHAFDCGTCMAILEERRDRLFSFSNRRLPLAGLVGMGLWKLRHVIAAHPLVTAAASTGVAGVVAVSLVLPPPHHATAAPTTTSTVATTTTTTTSTPSPSTTTTVAPASTTTTTPASVPVVTPAVAPTTTIVTTPARTSSMSVSWSSPTAAAGNPVQLTANVSGTPSTPTGTVVWSVNGVDESSTPVSASGVSTWTWTPTQPGTYSIVATLTPTGGFPATSATTSATIS